MHAEVTQLPFWARSCENPALKISCVCLRLAPGFRRCCPRCWVLPRHGEVEGAPGGPCHGKSHHWLNHQHRLITQTCSWYPRKSEI